MEVSTKGLILAGSIAMTLIMLTIGFYVTNASASTATNTTAKINKLNNDLSESDKTMYNGNEIQGSEVVNVINKFKSDGISIKVITKKSTTYYNRFLTGTDSELGTESTASIRDALKITSDNYINQNAMFLGEVLRDTNNTIIGIKFVQQ